MDKKIILLGALGVGAYFLLSGDSGNQGLQVGGDAPAGTVIPAMAQPTNNTTTGSTPQPIYNITFPTPQNVFPSFEPSFIPQAFNQPTETPTAKKDLITTGGGTVALSLPSGSVPSGSTVQLTDYGKSLQGLGIHTQSGYTTSSTNPNEKMVFLDPFSSSTPKGGSIHAVASITAPTKKETSTFTNKMGGSSSNSGGTWVGSTFHRGSYK